MQQMKASLESQVAGLTAQRDQAHADGAQLRGQAAGLEAQRQQLQQRAAGLQQELEQAVTVAAASALMVRLLVLVVRSPILVWLASQGLCAVLQRSVCSC